MNKNYQDIGIFVLRITLGIIFLAHGVQKIMAFEATAAFFGKMGLPYFLTYAVTALETGAGLFFLLGLLTRLAALGIAVNIMGAILTVKLQSGFIGGYEYDVLILASAVVLILSGSKFLALDTIIWKSKNKDDIYI